MRLRFLATCSSAARMASKLRMIRVPRKVAIILLILGLGGVALTVPTGGHLKTTTTTLDLQAAIGLSPEQVLGSSMSPIRKPRLKAPV